METKELKISIPKGYIIDQENSTFECIKFKPKDLTYDDIIKELFSKNYYYIDNIGNIDCTFMPYFISNGGTSKKQLEKLLAINKLMNVAKYLNGDWKPNWNNDSHKFYIFIDNDGSIHMNTTCSTYHSPVYFRTEKLLKQAIDILGVDVIKLALSTDW